MPVTTVEMLTHAIQERAKRLAGGHINGFASEVGAILETATRGMDENLSLRVKQMIVRRVLEDKRVSEIPVELEKHFEELISHRMVDVASTDEDEEPAGLCAGCGQVHPNPIPVEDES